MHLVFAIVCLAGGLGLLLYDRFTGRTHFQIIGLGISSGWFLLLLSAYNFVRWYAARSIKASEKAARIVHEARMRQVRHRERQEPDPTFDFSRDPESPGRPPLDAPPPNN